MTISRRKLKRNLVIIAAVAIILLVVGGVYFFLVIYPEKFHQEPAYTAGVEAMRAGDYAEAIRQFKECGEDYEDSRTRIRACELELKRQELEEKAKAGVDAWKKKKTPESLRAAVEGCYRIYSEGMDDGGKLQELGLLVLEETARSLTAKDYDTAVQMVSTFTDALPDTESRLTGQLWEDMYVALAKGLESGGQYLEAEKTYQKLKDAGVSGYEERIMACRKARAEQAFQEEDYRLAIGLFQNLIRDGEQGWEEKLKEAQYLYGKTLLEAGDYVNAVRYLDESGGYEDASALSSRAMFLYCEAHQADPDDTTRQYMKLLLAEDYAGARELDGQMNAWRLNITATELSKYSVQFVVTFHGGPKDGIEGFFCAAGTADGEETVAWYGIPVQDGSRQAFTLENLDTERFYPEIRWLRIYDPAENLLGSWEQE